MREARLDGSSNPELPRVSSCKYTCTPDLLPRAGTRASPGQRLIAALQPVLARLGEDLSRVTDETTKKLGRLGKRYFTTLLAQCQVTNYILYTTWRSPLLERYYQEKSKILKTALKSLTREPFNWFQYLRAA